MRVLGFATAGIAILSAGGSIVFLATGDWLRGCTWIGLTIANGFNAWTLLTLARDR